MFFYWRKLWMLLFCLVKMANKGLYDLGAIDVS